MAYHGSVAREKRADIVLGLPAAGKSSVIVNSLLKESKALLIDSDEAKQSLKEFDDGWGAGVVHEESKNIVVKLFKEALIGDMNIVIPIVGSTEKSVNKWTKVLKENGYTINLHLNDVDSTTSMSRLLKRYRDVGRFLDPTLVFEYGNKPSEVYETLKGEFNEYSKWSNEVRKGQRAILVERSELGGYLGESRAITGKSFDEIERGIKGSEEKVKLSLGIDSDYMDAVNSNDIETAQRLVDEAAKKAGYTIKPFHGTRSVKEQKDFTTFEYSSKAQ